MVKKNISKLLLEDVKRLRAVAKICLAPDHPVKLNDLEQRLLWEAEQDIIPSLNIVVTAIQKDKQGLNALRTLVECVRRIGPMTVLTDCQKEAWLPKIKKEQNKKQNTKLITAQNALEAKRFTVLDDILREISKEEISKDFNKKTLGEINEKTRQKLNEMGVVLPKNIEKSWPGDKTIIRRICKLNIRP